MRRSTSTGSCEAQPSSGSEQAETDLENVAEGDEEQAPGPVRKGTLSKDLRGAGAYIPKYTVHNVMSKLNTVGLIFGAIPMITILAFVTGNLHQASAVTAVVNGALSLVLVLYKRLNSRRETERGILMCGLALYMTVPLAFCAALAWWITGGTKPQISI